MARSDFSVCLERFLLDHFAGKKNGFTFEVAAQEANPTFPMPQPGFAALSYGLPTLVWIFGVQGSAFAIGMLVLTITVMSYFLAVVLVNRHFTGTARALALILVGMGPTFAVLFGNIGRHDVLIVTGSIIFGLGAARSWVAAVAGASLMFLGNPEQSLVALGSVFLLSLTSRFRGYFAPAAATLVLTLSGLLLLQAWAWSLGVDGRADWLLFHLRAGFLNFVGNAYLSVFAIYSLAWTVVLWRIVRSSGWDRLVFVVALVVVPIVMTMTTLDQTRVAVGVSTAALFAVLAVSLDDFSADLGRLTSAPVGWFFALACFLPTLEITYRGTQRIAFRWLYDLFVNSGLITKIDVGPW